MNFHIKIYPLFLLGAPVFYLIGYFNFLTKNRSRAGLCACAAAVCLVLFHAGWTRNRYMRMRLKKVDRLSGESFEQYLKAHFKKMGYKVKETRKSGDYGADLLLKKWGKTTVVQAKRYEKPVGLSAVQEVIGAMAYYEADKAMVITNRTFTRNARNLADQSGVDLWDRDSLRKEFGARE